MNTHRPAALVLLALCVALAGCGKKAEPEPYKPDLSTFEGALDAYVKAVEHGKPEWAEDVFTAAEREKQMERLRNQVAEAEKEGLKYTLLARDAQALQGPQETWAVHMTRIRVDDDGGMAAPSKLWFVFVKESDGKWRLNWELSQHLERSMAEQARRQPPAGNAPANAR